MRAVVPTAASGLTFTVGDMYDQYGNSAPNFFSVIVNVLGQNTGPSQTVLNEVTTVVQNNRPCGMPFTVTGPVLESVSVSATLTLQGGASSTAVITAANTAIQTYLNNIGLDPYGNSTTAQASEITVLLKQVTGVANVTSLTLNGATADITAGFGTQIVVGTMTFTTQ
jgi:phage-related baseplate assembly protein